MLNEQGKETENSVIETAALRFEKKLTEEISGVRVDLSECEKRMSEEISGVRVDLAESEKRFEKRLTEEISGMLVDLAESEKRLNEEVSEVRVELSDKIQKSKTDTIKWMFIFWIGQIGALLGILFAVFK
jgi:hypothetical protein